MKYSLATSLVLLSGALVSCQDQAAESTASSSLSVGTYQPPGTGSAPGNPSDAGQPSSGQLIVNDANEGGQADSFQLRSVAYGRLVELWGKTMSGGDVRVAREFVIGDAYAGDGFKVQLVTHPVLGIQRLMIDEAIDDLSGGRERFLGLAEAAALTTTPVTDAGADGSGVLTVIPRNAAIVMQFNDLVDENSLTKLGAMLRVGSPSVIPFEARLAAHDLIGGFDANTGDFHSTRVIVDFTISSLEAARRSSTQTVNSSGLPAGQNSGEPDAVLVLPTVATAGLTRPLVSSGGASLSPGTGSVDFGSRTKDVVRLFSVASSSSAFNGFLGDNVAPRLVAEAEVQITVAPQQDPLAPDVFVLPQIQFTSFGCAGPPQIGDIITQPGLVAEVIADGGPSTAAALDNVLVRLLEFPSTFSGPEQWETDGVGVAFYSAPYDLLMDDRRIACLVGVTPTPVGGLQAPTRGVSPDAFFELRFNEPIGDNGENQLESVLISSTPIAPDGPFNGLDVALSVGMPSGMTALSGGYLTRPEVPLAHEAGTAEVYYITPRLGASAVRDLAGNVLLESPGPIALNIDPAAASVSSGSVLFGFNSADEIGDARSAIAGQISSDFGSSLTRPRPVVRFQANIDNSQPILQQQTPFPQGVRTPFTPFGARMQAVWRYADMGFGLTDPNTINIDVEGLFWAPSNNTLIADSFSEFEIKLSHSRFAPDEAINPNTLFPRWSFSGLRPLFGTNVLQDEAQEVVHPRGLGYTFTPGDLVTAPTGETIAPFPLNRVAGEPTRTFTWRDTSIRTRTGIANGGVEPEAYLIALGVPLPQLPFYQTGAIQTIGLPLLLDISTFADPTALGLNGWVLNLAVNSSSRPFFRAFSAGGIDVNGNAVIVDPDIETEANGGFSPGSNPPGQATFGRDNSLLLGAADFVVRTSLAHTIWVDAGSVAPTRQFTQPVASTSVGSPLGTSVTVDVRGATEIVTLNSGDPLNDNDTDNNGVADMLEDAGLLDLYGDFYNEVDGVALQHSRQAENPGVTFVTSMTMMNGSDWRENVSTIDGARYIQLRLTFDSDIELGTSASVDAVGVAWTE